MVRVRVVEAEHGVTTHHDLARAVARTETMLEGLRAGLQACANIRAAGVTVAEAAARARRTWAQVKATLDRVRAAFVAALARFRHAEVPARARHLLAPAVCTRVNRHVDQLRAPPPIVADPHLTHAPPRQTDPFGPAVRRVAA